MNQFNYHKRCAPANGFTLLEVLAALLIVSLALSGLLIQMSRYTDNTAYIRDKTIAHWVALNQLELELLANRYSNELLQDVKSGISKMAHRQWHWEIAPKKTGADGFVQLEVRVFAEADDSDPLVKVVGFADQYHRHLP